MAFIVRRVDANGKTFGEKLRSLRVHSGISLQQAAQDTNIQLKHLQALESSNFSSLPEPSVAKYFLKTFVEYLGGEPKYFLEMYKNECGACELTSPMLLPKQRMQKTKLLAPHRILAGAAVLLAIFAVLGYIGYEITAMLRPPEIEIFEPADETITNKAVINIRGSVAKQATVKINNRAIALMPDGTFEAEVDLERGTNVIEIEARKRYSKPKTIYRRVVLEPENPL
ncbi:MAG: transcriptional regulator, XRE family [uncultured bacterium]|nr:MAG: transcriptional regulator, XRE family [uncultured bacterium]HBD05422.1 hypothetical protein [Candidatus Uhrbacteria bacterium]